MSAFHDAAVNEGSKRLVQQHSTQFNSELILMQVRGLQPRVHRNNILQMHCRQGVFCTGDREA